MAGRVRSFSDEEVEVLRQVARRLKEENGWSGRELGDAIGIAQQNASRFVAARSTAGMDRTTANRLAIVAGYRDVEHLLLDAGVLAEMKPLPTAPEWRDRDIAMSIARKIGYSDEVILAVAHRYSEASFRHKGMLWWNNMIAMESLARAGDVPPTPNGASTPAPAAAPPARKRSG